MTTKLKHKKLTEQELVEAYIFPHGLSAQEKAETDAEVSKLWQQQLRDMPEEQRVYGNLLGLKYRILDYLKSGEYSGQNSFEAFLEQYIKVLNKKHKDFAGEISLHPTKLSQLLSGKIGPNLSLVYRLEKHSGGVIPALIWWRLQMRKTENTIRQDKVGRQREAKKVKNELKFREADV
jgi:plasmid maintenance system antidote protein VapI